MGTMRESRCLNIPLSIAGCASAWLAAIGLLVLATFVRSSEIGRWGLLVVGAAVAWTVLLGNTREHRRVLDDVEFRVRRALQEERLPTVRR